MRGGFNGGVPGVTGAPRAARAVLRRGSGAGPAGAAGAEAAMGRGLPGCRGAGSLPEPRFSTLNPGSRPPSPGSLPGAARLQQQRKRSPEARGRCGPRALPRRSRTWVVTRAGLCRRFPLGFPFQEPRAGLDPL